MRKACCHGVPDLVALGTSAVENIRSTTVLDMPVFGVSNFTGAWACVFEELPVATRASPLDFGW